MEGDKYEIEQAGNNGSRPIGKCLFDKLSRIKQAPEFLSKIRRIVCFAKLHIQKRFFALDFGMYIDLLFVAVAVINSDLVVASIGWGVSVFFNWVFV